MKKHKGLLKKAAQSLLINFSKNASKGSVVEISFNNVEDGSKSEYEKLCEDVVGAVENRYSLKFRLSRFDVKLKKGIKTLAIKL